MKTIRSSLASLLAPALILSCVAAQAQHRPRRQTARPARESPPQPTPLKPFSLPATREARLENGLALLLVEDHRSPLVTIEIALPVGSVNNPPEQSGLAEATAELLLEGAGSRSSMELAVGVEALGATIDSFATDDYTSVAAAVIAENLDPFLDILADVVLRPAFPDREVELFKTNRVADLKVQRQDPAFVAMDHFSRLVYGSHPYAFLAPTPESISGLSRSKIERFYRARYVPNGSAIVIVGDFPTTRMEQRLRSLFGAWKGSDAPGRDFPRIPGPARRLRLIDRPGSEQADIIIGNAAISSGDPSYFPMVVANAILGVGAGSRLFLSVREQKGYSYDVWSEVRAPRMRGVFFAAAQTRPEVTVPAIRLMLAEIRRLQTELVSARDVRAAKNYLNGGFSLALSTQGGITERLILAHMMGLGTEYLETYRDRIEAVTPAEIRQAARKHMLADRCSIVVVGDADQLSRRLRTLGPVESRRTDG